MYPNPKYHAGSAKLPYPFDDYEVNELGEIYSFKRSKVVRPVVDHNGYLLVRLYDGRGNRTSKSVGRLVAENFLEKANKRNNTLIYKDHDRTNCSLDNLKWVTRAYAIRYYKQLEERDHWDQNHMKVRVKEEGSPYLPKPVGTIAEAAEKYGLLYNEIAISASEGRPCPTDMRYTFEPEYVEELLRYV